jgi:hypothetical protein
MKVTYDTRQFEKEMRNIMEYSAGFIQGVQNGRGVFFSNLGSNVIETLKQYIDSNARIDPEALSHVYEWYQTGSPNSRLFDIQYSITSGGLSFNSTFTQSTSIKNGSRVPFYNKADIMENGIPVVIKPVRSSVLSFNDNGEQVFTRKPVLVENPGGNLEGQYQKVFDSFFNSYFTQAYLQSSGMVEYLRKPEAYKKNLNAAKRGGASLGVNTGYQWISKAGGDL